MKTNQRTSRHPRANAQLPADWRWVRLEEICQEDRQIVEPDSVEAASLTYYSLEHVESGTGRILRTPDIAMEDAGKSVTFRFDQRHVLYGKLRPYLNKVALPDGPGRCTTEMIPLLPRPGVDRDFLAWLLRRPETVEYAMQVKTGSRMPRTNIASLLKLEVPLPPVSEQRRLASILNEQMSLVEKARAAAKARLAAIEALPVAYYRQEFGNVPTLSASALVPTEPSRRGWSWYRLTDLARLATGHTPSRYCKEYWGGDIPWLQLADIRALDGREAFDTTEHTNALGIENSSAVLLPKGTVCLSRTASVGFVTIMGRPMATSQDFVNWICGDSLDPWFLMHLLIANRRTIVELGCGAVHPTIYFPTVQAFSVCIPPIEEQRRIVASLRHRLEVVEKARTAARAELEAINSLPAALIRKAFNGEM